MKVLIVEDAPLVRMMDGLVFSKREHELTTAEDGRKALATLGAATGSFDLILLDLRMPDMGGVGFIRPVRRTGRFHDVPVGLTTIGPDASERLQDAVALGVAAAVKNPWKPQELRAVVQAVLHEPRH